MFGYKLIKTKEYDRLKDIEQRAYIAYRWFGGFTDLDIIWDFLFKPKHGIVETRELYAKARNTNVYGKPKETN